MKSYSLAAFLCCIGVGSWVSPALGEQIYDNRSFVTHLGAHASGADVSLAQDVAYPGYTALGFTAGPDYRLSDDFIVPVGEYWYVDALDLFAFQIDNDAAFTDARVIIWNGPPDGFGSIKLFDGTATNVLATSTPGAYRIAQSAQSTAPFTDTRRHVQKLGIAVTGTDSPTLRLSAGTYWVDWQLKGPQADVKVFTPPVSILGQPYTSYGGFARYKCPEVPGPDQDCAVSPGAWRLLSNGPNPPPYLVDLPFRVHGTIIVDSIFRGTFEPIATTP